MFVIRMRDYDVMRVKPTGRMNDMNFALCVLRNDALQVYVRACVRSSKHELKIEGAAASKHRALAEHSSIALNGELGLQAR